MKNERELVYARWRRAQIVLTENLDRAYNTQNPVESERYFEKAKQAICSFSDNLDNKYYEFYKEDILRALDIIKRGNSEGISNN